MAYWSSFSGKRMMVILLFGSLVLFGCGSEAPAPSADAGTGKQRVRSAREKTIHDFAMSLVVKDPLFTYTTQVMETEVTTTEDSSGFHESSRPLGTKSIVQERHRLLLKKKFDMTIEQLDQILGKPDFDIVTREPSVEKVGKDDQKWRGYYRTYYWCVPDPGATTITRDFDGNVEHKGLQTLFTVSMVASTFVRGPRKGQKGWDFDGMQIWEGGPYDSLEDVDDPVSGQ